VKQFNNLCPVIDVSREVFLKLFLYTCFIECVYTSSTIYNNNNNNNVLCRRFKRCFHSVWESHSFSYVTGFAWVYNLFQSARAANPIGHLAVHRLVCIKLGWIYTCRVGTAAAAPPPFRPGNPALCGSRPLITPYYCRLGDSLCFVFIVCLLYFSVNCVLYSMCSFSTLMLLVGSADL